MKRVDTRRMDELNEKICVQMCLTGRLVKCWLRWVGHLVQMGKREWQREGIYLGSKIGGKEVDRS